MRRVHRTKLLLTVLTGLLLSVASAHAQPAGDLDRKLFEPAPAGEGSPAGADRWRRELGAAAVSEAEDPLANIAFQMRVAQERIARLDCGRQTQQTQQAIVADLDRLIAEAQSQAQASPGKTPPRPGLAQQPAGEQPKTSDGPAGNKPSGQAQQGRGAQAGKPEPSGPRQLRAVFGQAWGELPEQARQQLLEQWSAEQFLPEYAPLVEEYFRRLAEAAEKE